MSATIEAAGEIAVGRVTIAGGRIAIHDEDRQSCRMALEEPPGPGRQAMPENYAPPPGTIKVLEWIPPEVDPDFPNGHWSLEPVEEWLDFTRPERVVDIYEAGMNTEPEALGAWAAGQLGYPVRLVSEDDPVGVSFGPFRPLFAGRNRVTRLINRHWPLRWIPRRLYWVTPGLYPPRF